MSDRRTSFLELRSLCADFLSCMNGQRTADRGMVITRDRAGVKQCAARIRSRNRSGALSIIPPRDRAMTPDTAMTHEPPPNTGKLWSELEDRDLRNGLEAGYSIVDVAAVLRRSIEEVETRMR